MAEYPLSNNRNNLVRPKSIVVKKDSKQVAIILDGIVKNLNLNLKPRRDIQITDDIKNFLREHFRERQYLSVTETNNLQVVRDIEEEISPLSYDDRKEVLQVIKDFKKKKAEKMGPTPAKQQKHD